MDYPTPDENGTLPLRARLTYCLGMIASVEAELRSALLDSWQAALDKSHEERHASRLTSGQLVKALVKALGRPEYDWLPDCREALGRIAETVQGRNAALHGEWMLRSDGFVTSEIVRANGPALGVPHFEALWHRLSISADNAVGIATLVRWSRHHLEGRRIDPAIERINRELVSRVP